MEYDLLSLLLARVGPSYHGVVITLLPNLKLEPVSTTTTSQSTSSSASARKTIGRLDRAG